MYWASVILSEDDWQIEVLISTHNRRQEAEDIAIRANSFLLTVHSNAPAVQLCSFGKILYRYNEEVIIKELSQTKLRHLGHPLNPANENDAEIAFKALLTQDPAYFITEEDMVLSNRTLSNFLFRYGKGYKLDAIAYGVKAVIS